MILTTQNVSKKFGGNTAVNRVNIEIPQKKITSIIGPNGSGKSTLFNLITKLLELNEGKIFINQSNITKQLDFQVTSKKISRTFQELRIFPYLNIEQHMQLALSNNQQNIVKNFFSPVKIKTSTIQHYLNLVGLQKDLSTQGHELSYGQSKLLNLSMNLAKPHEILLLDEPVSGINPQLRNKIAKILIELKKKGETILLIEHDINFVINLSDLIIVMDSGKVILQGDKKVILSNKKVLKAYLGK